jgi:hypothetical protein
VIGQRRFGGAAYEPRWDASVDLVLERQNGLNWCWAAVAKGIVEHYGGPIRKQCQYATQFLRQKKSCCRAGAPRPVCDVAHDVDSVLVHYGMFAAPPFHRPVSLATVRRELERDRPVVALIRFPELVHAVIIDAVDVVNRRVGVLDPKKRPVRKDLDFATFQHAYAENGRWFYTILTRPPATGARLTKVSLLRDRMHEEDRGVMSAPDRRSESLEIDLYEADPFRVAEGTGLQTAEFSSRRTVRLDVFDSTDGALWLDEHLTPLRDEIEARLARGFEVRFLRSYAFHLQVLWFTDPSDPSHRKDHYLPVPWVPYYLEEGREYSPAELRDALIKISPCVLQSIEINKRWIERLDRETAYQGDEEP